MSKVKFYNRLHRMLYGEEGLVSCLLDYLYAEPKNTWIGVTELLQAINTDKYYATPRSSDYHDGKYNLLMKCIDQLREHKLDVFDFIQDNQGREAGLALYDQAKKKFDQAVSSADPLNFDVYVQALNGFFGTMWSLKPHDEFYQRLQKGWQDCRKDLKEGMVVFSTAHAQALEASLFMSASNSVMNTVLSKAPFRKSDSMSQMTDTTEFSRLIEEDDGLFNDGLGSIASDTVDLNHQGATQKHFVEKIFLEAVKPSPVSSEVADMARLIEAQAKQMEAQAKQAEAQAQLLAAYTEQMKAMSTLMAQLGQGLSVGPVTVASANVASPVYSPIPVVEEPQNNVAWGGRAQKTLNFKEATLSASLLLELYLGRTKDKEVIHSVFRFDEQGAFAIDDRRLNRFIGDLANFDIVIAAVLPDVNQWKAGVAVITPNGLYQLNKAGTEVVQVLDVEALTALGLEAQVQASASATKTKSISAAIAEQMTALDQALTDKGGKSRQGLMKEAEKAHSIQFAAYREALNQNHDVIKFAKDVNKHLSRLVDASAMGGKDKHMFVLGQATNFTKWCRDHETHIQAYKAQLTKPPLDSSAHLETSVECGDQLVMANRVDGKAVPHEGLIIVHPTVE